MHGRPPGASGRSGRSSDRWFVVLAAWNNVARARGCPAGPGCTRGSTARPSRVLLGGRPGRPGSHRAELGLSARPATGRGGLGRRSRGGGRVRPGRRSARCPPSDRCCTTPGSPGSDDGAMAYRALLRIPGGTVLWEEVAFRGVLHAALSRELPPRAAAAAGGALRPLAPAARPGRDPRQRTRSDAGRPHASPCCSAARARRRPEPLFGRLRQRSGSLLAPALLHLAANSGGLLASVATARRGARAGASFGRHRSSRQVPW